MISSNLRQVVRSAAEEFGVEAVWLFGSAVEDEASARDIDLAVEGLPPERFFDFYGRLYFALSQPVDLVDLSQDPPIAAIVRARGVRIYERGS
jgi:predicted nucleotidyltransferase